MEPVLFKDKEEFGQWLSKNHDKATEVWVQLYNKASGKTSVTYPEAVEEGLCYGWIDGLTKKYDTDSSMIRFTPRKEKSNWSESNIIRVERLIKENRMKEPGMRLVQYAKDNGLWTDLSKELEIPKELNDELKKNRSANAVFAKYSRSHKMEYINWVRDGKKRETRVTRAKKAIERILN